MMTNGCGPLFSRGSFCRRGKRKTRAGDRGAAGVGWGLGLGLALIVVDYAKVLNEGLNKIVKDAEEELRNLRFLSADDVKKADFLRSVIIALPAIVRIAQSIWRSCGGDGIQGKGYKARRKSWRGLRRPATGSPATRQGHSTKRCSPSGSSG